MFPLAFFSGKLSDTEKKYSAFDRELLAAPKPPIPPTPPTPDLEQEDLEHDVEMTWRLEMLEMEKQVE